MARRYRKVEVPMWTDQKFRELSAAGPSAQTLWLYLLCGTRTTVFPGLVVASPAILANDLGWPLDPDLFRGDAVRDASATHRRRHCGCVRDAISELTDHGMIKVDPAGVIMLTKALFTAPGEPRDSSKPGSANQLIGWEKAWSDIPECELKNLYLSELNAFADACSTALGTAFRTAFATHRRRIGDASETRVELRNRIQEQEDQRSGRAKRTGRSRSPTQPSGDLDAHDRRDRDPDPGSDAPAPTSAPAPAPRTPYAVPAVAMDAKPALASLPLQKSDNVTAGIEPIRALPPNPLRIAPELAVSAPKQIGDVTPDSELVARRAFATNAWNRMNRVREELAAEWGMEKPRHLHFHLPGYAQLLARLGEAGANAEGDFEHVFAMAVAEARATEPRSLQYLSGTMFTKGAWEFKLGRQASDVDTKPRRPGGFNAFDAVDEATRSMSEAQERRGPMPASVFSMDFDADRWTGPVTDDLTGSGSVLRWIVPGERWPYGPPSAHEKCCNLFPRRGSPGGLFCDCAASAADGLDQGVSP